MDAIHVCLNVSDADRLAEWYAENLGFERSWEFTADGTRNVYVADSNGFEIQLSDSNGEETFEAGTAWDHLAVTVDDVDETVETVDHHGVVKAPADHPKISARIAFVEDPDGHVVEFVQSL